MGFLNKFVDNLKSRQREDDDEYFLDDDYYDENEYYDDEEPQQPQPKRPGLFSRRDSGSGEQRSGGFFSRKVVPIDGGTGMQVTMKRPASLDDSRDICDDLLAGKAVVINLEGISTDTAQRIIDFTLGAVYSIDGDLQMISKYIFIASPHTVELSGDFAGDFAKMNSGSSQPEMRSRASGFSFNG